MSCYLEVKDKEERNEDDHVDDDYREVDDGKNTAGQRELVE